MRKLNAMQFDYAAECGFSASYSASASDAYLSEAFAAIISVMAVILYASLCRILALDIHISIILGIILVIVRRNAKPVSRT